MKKARLRVMLHVFGIAALASAISAAPASAQNSDDCRCVDAQGNAIENCSCFRASPFRGFLQGFALQADARPRIGISVDPQQSARNDARGARVTSLMEDGPADLAGIRVGDMITSVDGRSLLEPLSGNAEDAFDLDASIPVQRLLAISADLEDGQEVEIEYVHSGEAQTATLEARELSAWGRLTERVRQDARSSTLRLRASQPPDIHVFTGPNASATILGDWGRNLFAIGMGRIHGIDLLEMKPGLASYFGTEDGMLVTNVDEDSTLGLEPGDVILRIGDREVTGASRILRILSSYDEDEDVTLHIMRDHDEMTVTGRLGG